MIRIKRIYDEPGPRDGVRVLVDRLWPRGLGKERARLDDWRKDLAPSAALRKWFAHDPARWEEFRRRYRRELSAPPQGEALNALARLGRRKTVTLLYGAADERHNQAVVLKEVLACIIHGGSSRKRAVAGETGARSREGPRRT